MTARARLRRVVGAAAVLLLFAGGSSSGTPAAPRPLLVRDATGQIVLSGRGTVRGVVRAGEIWVGDATDAALLIVNAHTCAPSAGAESCSGQDLGFRLARRGPLFVRVSGSGISATVTLRGTVEIDATSGAYRIGAAALRPFPLSTLVLHP